jgi:hypothetical protein
MRGAVHCAVRRDVIPNSCTVVLAGINALMAIMAVVAWLAG